MVIKLAVLGKVRPSQIVAKVFVFILLAILLFGLNQVHAKTNWFSTKSISHDFNNDGTRDVVNLVLKENDIGVAEGFLELRTKGNNYRSTLIAERMSESGISVIEVTPKGKSFIGLVSSGGMHSMTLVLYSFEGKALKEEISIFSDTPFIDVQDIDNDGFNEIIATCRDYDKVPYRDEIKKVYKFRRGNWELTNG